MRPFIRFGLDPFAKSPTAQFDPCDRAGGNMLGHGKVSWDISSVPHVPPKWPIGEAGYLYHLCQLLTSSPLPMVNTQLLK